MDTGRFDALSRSLSSRLSRRTALLASGFGLAASLAAAPPRAGAQDATPNPLAADATFLFVQTAAGGTFAANPGAGTPAAVDGSAALGGGADYLLTLTGHTGNTIYFSDRPERIFGEAPTQTFLDGLGFPANNPPNAALVTKDANGTEDILVIELFGPNYDAAAQTVSYGVNILSDYEGDGLAHVASRQEDEELDPAFGETSLFIDDCSDADPLVCQVSSTCDIVGDLGNRGMCWKWADLVCEPCSGGWDGTAQECNERFPACAGTCITDQCGGMVL